MLLKKPAACLATAIIALSLGAQRADAQVNLFKSYAGPFLTEQDYTFGKQAAWDLLEGPATVGAHKDWTNPGTGNGGTLTILGVSTAASLPCRRVKSYVHYREATETVTYVLNVCKQADQSWKIVD